MPPFIRPKLFPEPTGLLMTFEEIIQRINELVNHERGHLYVESVFDNGTAQQKDILLEKIMGNVFQLSMLPFSCFVITRALRTVSPEKKLAIVTELKDSVIDCAKNENGCYVIEKCIEELDHNSIKLMLQSITKEVSTLCVHECGYNVIISILKNCGSAFTAPIFEYIYKNLYKVMKNKFCSKIFRHILEHGHSERKSQLIKKIRNKLLELSQDQLSGAVLEKSIVHINSDDKMLLIQKMCSFTRENLYKMMTDRYAHAVVIAIICESKPEQSKILMSKIIPHFRSLRTNGFGNHTVRRLEDYMKNTFNKKNLT